MIKTAPLNFFNDYDKAEIREIKDGRLAYLVFQKQGQEFSVVFDLERRMVIGVYSPNTVPISLTYAERSRMTYSIAREMESREGCFVFLFRCPKCRTYVTKTCKC